MVSAVQVSTPKHSYTAALNKKAKRLTTIQATGMSRLSRLDPSLVHKVRGASAADLCIKGNCNPLWFQ
ncbi:hypothetical protein GDO78_021839 [Eleutherodactylus coqui]|uniref:Uncharacterized protein n=1 Tax=Eleutherodactylus coqui TaxID=57060 RepID=A0A8J6BGZ1_ELECQ|nr:hypothetical protein GDO78_021839 [Eleutherodactylus coqui]